MILKLYFPMPAARALRQGLFLLLTLLLISGQGLSAQQPDDDVPSAQQLVTIALSDGRIESATAILSTQISGSVSIFGKAANTRVTVLAEEQPIESVLNMIANPAGFIWWKEDNGDYGIADREFYERNILPKKVIQKVFMPKNIKASELDKAIKALITPNVGSSVADDRTNKLIVNDLPQALERIERFIREIDVQLVIRVFYIRHTNVEDIAKKIENYKSDPGTIEVDTRTRQIIVTDLLANIKKMELLIDILDVGPEIVIYDVNNIGIDGEELEDLKAIIDSIRTKDDTLLFEVNEKQGVFILEDVPEVHERVEQLLAGFDQPVKQVLLQGEIVSTSFDRNFNFGLDRFAWSKDLSAAASEGAIPGGTAGSPGVPGIPGGPFTDIDRVFPSFNLAAGVVAGNYLNQRVFLQYSAAYNDSNSKVLLQPRLLVKNQQSSRIFVGSEVPYLTTFFDDIGNNDTRRTQTQSTVTDGLTFEVTPSISNSYLIELDLSIDNDKANIEEEGSVRLVGRDRQQVETILQIPSGQTRMIGGLVSNSDSVGNAGLPFLSSLPWIGPIFGKRSTLTNASNLLIFITPSIVEDVLPRPTTEDGRRGRLVSNYERVPGEFSMQLEENDLRSRAVEEGGIDGVPIDLENMLSGDSNEESAFLNELEARRLERNRALLEDDGGGNYVPSLGTGSAAINTPPGAGGTAGQQQRQQLVPRPQPPTATAIGEVPAISPVPVEAANPQPPPPPPPTQNETNYR